jgi:catechol 2,3-dioxygenase-like lactoylglutathione lyase family enzyme
MAAATDPLFIAKTHLSLRVADMERSVRFYEAFFGARVHKRRPDYANFDLDVPPLKLALEQGEATPGAGPLNHLGIQVATREQVMEARDRLKDAGLATFDEGDTVCCYARQDKLWATDPDGNPWEVYVLLDEMLDEDEQPAAPAGCAPASTCCG